MESELLFPPTKRPIVAAHPSWDQLVPNMVDPSGAEISDDKIYRYKLWRAKNPSLPAMVWVMLNPSTADAVVPDPTVTRCVGFAERWGFGGIVVVNLFAFRSTDPNALKEGGDVVGRPRGVDVIYEVVDAKPKLIVAAWGGGVPDGHDIHVNAVRNVLRSNGAQCLGHTKAGEPKHPVRLAYETKLRPL